MPRQLVISRREFTRLLGVGAASQILFGCAGGNTVMSAEQGWWSADEIKANTRLPSFAKRDFIVENFNAVANKDVDCTAPIAAAIQACNAAGGGRVVLARGVYRSGPIHLLSNVELHIAAGSEISFYTDPEKFLPPVMTRWEGVELFGYSPLVYAYQQSNIAVTGGGILNGNADNDTWWPWKGDHSQRHWSYDPAQDQKTARDKLFDMAEQGVEVSERIFAQDSYLRPAFVQFYRCQAVLIEGVTITAAPFWLVHPTLCDDVTVRGVKFSSHGPNSDGCDPESCNRVVIENCTFDTGDDCIAVKSGRNADGRRLNVPCQNVLIQDCVMKSGHGGVVLGSEISGGVRNLHARNCVMSSPDLERAIRIKTNAKRGGVIEHIRYENIEVGEVQDAIVVNFYYEEGPNGDWPPTVKDVEIKGFSARNAKRALVLRGFPDNPVSGLRMVDCHITRAESVGVIENVSGIQLSDVSINGDPLSAEELK